MSLGGPVENDKVRRFTSGIPCLRHAAHEYPRLLQGFVDLIIALKRLSRSNMVHFISVTMNPLQIVMKRMAGRDPMEYLQEHPEANRICLVSPFLFIAFKRSRQGHLLSSCWM